MLKSSVCTYPKHPRSSHKAQVHPISTLLNIAFFSGFDAYAVELAPGTERVATLDIACFGGSLGAGRSPQHPCRSARPIGASGRAGMSSPARRYVSQRRIPDARQLPGERSETPSRTSALEHAGSKTVCGVVGWCPTTAPMCLDAGSEHLCSFASGVVLVISVICRLTLSSPQVSD